jgi:Lysophospholipase
VRDLRDRGFAVAMIDWRGQGHSSRRLRDPRKGYVRDFSDFESTSKPSCSRWCCRIARRPISRWRIRWAAR